MINNNFFLNLIFSYNLLIFCNLFASFQDSSLCVQTPYEKIERPFNLMSAINVGKRLDCHIPWIQLFQEHKDGIIVKISKKNFTGHSGKLISNYQFTLPVEDSQAVAYLYIKKDHSSGLFKSCDVTTIVNFELSTYSNILKYMYQNVSKCLSGDT